MKAIRHYGFGGPIQIDDVEPPSPTAREVVVRVKRCQIGGDVLKVLAGTGPVRDAENYVFPHTGGYRGAGVVEAVGPGVKRLKVGDEVRISRYQKPFKLLLNPKRSYYEVLHAKLKWGERG